MLSSIILYRPYTSKRGIIHIWKNVTEFKTLKIAFGLSFFNLCVSRPLVQTTRFVVKYLQKPLTCKVEICINVHKLPSLKEIISRTTFIQLIFFNFNIISFAQSSIIFTSNFIKKNQVFGHKKSGKNTRIFLNTDFGNEKNPLT